MTTTYTLPTQGIAVYFFGSDVGSFGPGIYEPPVSFELPTGTTTIRYDPPSELPFQAGAFSNVASISIGEERIGERTAQAGRSFFFQVEEVAWSRGLTTVLTVFDNPPEDEVEAPTFGFYAAVAGPDLPEFGSVNDLVDFMAGSPSSSGLRPIPEGSRYAPGSAIPLDDAPNVLIRSPGVIRGSISDDTLSVPEAETEGTHVFGREGDDILSGGDGSFDDRLFGGPGDDLLIGGALRAYLDGGPGNDTLGGGGSRDTLDGGAGDDLLIGGTESDLYIVRTLGDRVVEEAERGRDDEVRTFVDYRLDGTGVERLTAQGPDGLRLTASTGAETITGGSGDDTLIGFAGDGTLAGRGGADAFAIVARREALSAEYSVSDPDRILDFSGSRGEGDRLVMDDRMLGLGTRQVELREIAPEEAARLLDDGTVRYDIATGILSIDFDGDGERGDAIKLTAGTALTLDDVLIF